MPPGRAPHQHDVALLHPRPVAPDEHAVARRVAQRVDRRLLPRQVGRLRHQLVGLDDRQVGEPAEVGLEPPDALVGGEHRVVVRRRILVVDGVAVDGHAVAGLPVAHRRPDPQHDARRVGADDVVGQRMACRPRALAGEAVEEAERRQRLEDRRPHRVEVDARRHHRDVRLVGRQLGRGDVADVQALARVLLGGLDAGEHLGVLAPDERRSVVVGDGEAGQLVAARARLDGLQDLLHGRKLLAGSYRRRNGAVASAHAR